MLGHPVFLAAEVGSDTQSEALLAEEHVSAVAGVDRPDGVVLREVADVTVVLIELSLGVQTLDVVVAVADGVKHIVADAGHDEHVEHDVDGVGKLDAVLCEVGTNDTHGVGDNVHGSALHGAAVDLFQSLVALGGFDPVVDVAGFFFCGGADEGSALNARDIVDGGAVQVAAGQKLLIELYHFAGRASLGTKLFSLFLAAVDPDDLVGAGHVSHFLDPVKNVLVVGHVFSPLIYVLLYF